MSVTLPRAENEAVAVPTAVLETQRVWGRKGPRGAVKVVRNHPGPSPNTVGIDPAGAVVRGAHCRARSGSAAAKALRQKDEQQQLQPPSLTGSAYGTARPITAPTDDFPEMIGVITQKATITGSKKTREPKRYAVSPDGIVATGATTVEKFAGTEVQATLATNADGTGPKPLSQTEAT